MRCPSKSMLVALVLGGTATSLTGQAAPPADSLRRAEFDSLVRAHQFEVHLAGDSASGLYVAVRDVTPAELFGPGPR